MNAYLRLELISRTLAALIAISQEHDRKARFYLTLADKERSYRLKFELTGKAREQSNYSEARYHMRYMARQRNADFALRVAAQFALIVISL